MLLWNIAGEKALEKELNEKAEISEEKNLIFVGSRESVNKN